MVPNPPPHNTATSQFVQFPKDSEDADTEAQRGEITCPSLHSL